MSTPNPDDERLKNIRRQRNVVLGLALAGFAVLVYFIALVRMS